MQKFLSILTWLLLLHPAFVFAADQPVLLEIQKQEGLGNTRISLFFDRLPEFTSEHSGQRLDIVLSKTQVSEGLDRLPEDETVVKILLAEKSGDTLVSFLLRRPPQQIVRKSRQNPARIDFNLYWESARGSRPAVAFRIEGIPGRKGGRKVRTEQEFPLWRENWRQLFQADLTPWQLDPDLKFSLPELPPLKVDQPSAALRQRLDLIAEKRWFSLLRFLPEMPPVKESERQTENLLVIEALLRTDGVAAAEMRLRQLEGLEDGIGARVDYLTAFALATSGQPFAAFLKLKEQLKLMKKGSVYDGLMTLLAAETAIASANDKQALTLLDNREVKWRGLQAQLLPLRRGDALVGTDQFEEAFKSYRKVDDPALFDLYPRARARAASAAYKVGEYLVAARLYKALGHQLEEKAAQSLALYAAAAARYNAGDMEWAQIGLQKVVLEMPGTEGADRAALRLQDHQVLNGNEAEQAQARYRYAEIAKRSRVRALREEATFKQALVLYLLRDSAASVQLLIDFRRDFAGGALRAEGDSLLREQLPGVISSLIDVGKDMAAVVLVEQNRRLLLKGELSKEFLDNIAGALTRLGLFKRAARIVLFQLDRAPDKAAREEFYLPLAQLYQLRREYRAAVDYARTYLDTYPRGAVRSQIYGLMLDALEKQKQYEELLRQLEREDRPQSAALDIRAAWLYWQQDQPQKVIERLENARKLEATFASRDMALLAETYYQQGQNARAEAIYRSLQDDPTFGAQAGYRSAQLLLREGQKKSALKLLRNFVEKDKSGAWSLLAQDLLKELGVTNF